ncbi:hypothetical protein ABW19_dt0207194 [Dactylella cylindrospora]|nr:hypothetical protein ABW19_dt0207194 [Dactylella cylindrospora]
MDSRARTDGTFEELPFKPLTTRSTTLSHNRIRRRFRKATPRILVTLLAVPFLALPIVAWTVHGKATALHSTGWYLMKVTEVSLATRLAEKGCTLGTLEQLIGTSTTSSAVILPFTLQAFNTLTVILFLLFALSPLGSQATLRIISISPNTTYHSRNITVLNPFGVSSQFAGANSGQSTLQADGIYAASVLSPASIKKSALDVWGNIKVPLLEWYEMNASPVPNEEGWYTTPAGGAVYSSLLGWPISLSKNSSGAPFIKLSDTTFSIDTAYWYMDCPTLSVVTSNPCDKTGPAPLVNGSSFAAQCFNTSSPKSNIYFPRGSGCYGQCLNLGYNRTYLQENFTSIDPMQWVALYTNTRGNLTVGECYLHQTFAEVNITCIDSQCHASAIRRLDASSLVQSNKSNTTNILSSNKSLIDHLIAFFTISMEDTQITARNGNNLYILNPEDPLSNINNFYSFDFTTVGALNFGIRLGQLLNTYYQASGTAFMNPERLLTEGFEFIGVNKTIDVAIFTDIYDVSPLWAGITLAASLMLFFFGVVSVAWAFTSLTPELFGVGMFTSLLAESRHVMKLDGGGDELLGGGKSMRDSDEKALLLKNRMVKIGDVRGDGDVGYISFGMSEAEIRKDKVEKQKLRKAVVSLDSERIYG